MILLAALSVLGFLIAFSASGLVGASRHVISTGQEAMATMRDPNLHDDHKEVAMQKASISLFKAFFGIVLRFMACLLAAFVPLWLADVFGWIKLEQAISYLSRLDVILVISVIMIALWWLGRMIGRRDVDGYSFLDRTLHRLALGGTAIPNVLLDLEMSRFLPAAPKDGLGPHIVICGLARAGTTVLARDLFATGEFGSLTYRDMPFVMSPNTFSGLSKSAHIDKKERSHGDGLMVDLDSPEALDEVLWRLRTGRDYIKEDRLVPYQPTREQVNAYGDFQRLVMLKTGKRRYLSKSNNSCLRLDALAGQMPDTRFLVPFRSPVHQCRSLIRQQEKFTGGTRFQKDYMTWLGHHEFGDTHKPFVFGQAPVGNPGEVSYWRQIWLDTYSSLSEIAGRHGNVLLVSYNDLCRDPEYRETVLKEAGLEGFRFSELRELDAPEAEASDRAEWDEAMALYERMRATVLEH